ncbi:cysteine desulfurase [Pseudoalteromonas phenolica]|uniref:cysteine desulfurase family protein n=1 Tax=Pseudoalteromonas phenolica TaxID=161398 RepID=UPI00110BE0A5|nr:cysteine desulfurase family protein [Pseudoalteromonas phenolica]TMN87093.1 cysteine desulfurase [Pseudoalteromonas phenolica]
MIYLDTAASYPLLPEVKETLIKEFENHYANSAASHYLGEEVNKSINRVREMLADEIGAFPSEIVFTSGATESNNLAIKGALLSKDPKLKSKKHIVTSAIEHKCNLAICNYMESLGFEVTYLMPNKNGLITAESVKGALRVDTALVSIMHANNELGTLNPIKEIGQVCFENDVLFHCDAAQSLCKTEIDVDNFNVDFMSFSAHKIAGPKGIGALYIRDLREREIEPVIHGAGQEQGVRGGTVASPLIAAFGTAIELFPLRYKEFSKTKALEFFKESLQATGITYSENGHGEKLSHCCSFTFHDVKVTKLIRENDEKIAFAQGSACSSKEIQASHVLTALGFSREEAEKTFRISFPLDISHEQISFVVNAIKKAT